MGNLMNKNMQVNVGLSCGLLPEFYDVRDVQKLLLDITVCGIDSRFPSTVIVNDGYCFRKGKSDLERIIADLNSYIAKKTTNIDGNNVSTRQFFKQSEITQDDWNGLREQLLKIDSSKLYSGNLDNLIQSVQAQIDHNNNLEQDNDNILSQDSGVLNFLVGSDEGNKIVESVKDNMEKLNNIDTLLEEHEEHEKLQHNVKNEFQKISTFYEGLTNHKNDLRATMQYVRFAPSGNDNLDNKEHFVLFHFFAKNKNEKSVLFFDPFGEKNDGGALESLKGFGYKTYFSNSKIQRDLSSCGPITTEITRFLATENGNKVLCDAIEAATLSGGGGVEFKKILPQDLVSKLSEVDTPSIRALHDQILKDPIVDKFIKNNYYEKNFETFVDPFQGELIKDIAVKGSDFNVIVSTLQDKIVKGCSANFQNQKQDKIVKGCSANFQNQKQEYVSRVAVVRADIKREKSLKSLNNIERYIVYQIVFMVYNTVVRGGFSFANNSEEVKLFISILAKNNNIDLSDSTINSLIAPINSESFGFDKLEQEQIWNVLKDDLCKLLDKSSMFYRDLSIAKPNPDLLLDQLLNGLKNYVETDIQSSKPSSLLGKPLAEGHSCIIQQAGMAIQAC